MDLARERSVKRDLVEEKDWEKGKLVVRRVGCQQARRTTVEHAHFGLAADVEIA